MPKRMYKIGDLSSTKPKWRENFENMKATEQHWNRVANRKFLDEDWPYFLSEAQIDDDSEVFLVELWPE